MPAHIRAMIASDLAAARQLWSEVDGVEIAEGDSPEELTRYLIRNPGMSSVATEESGRLIGAVLCGHDGRRGFVYHLAVAPAYRGGGVGRKMIERSLAALNEAGLTRVLLLVSDDNPVGAQFWRRQGWEELTFARPFGRDL